MSQYKIIVMGSGGVGKSALTIQFVQETFVEKYDPTIEDCYKKTINLDGEYYTLEILDTAGTEQFMSLRDVYINSGDAFIIVYSVTSMSTFNDIQAIIEQINLVKGSEKVPIIIVGNKIDLKNEREVSEDLGLQLAKNFDCSFLETSAKLFINVNEIFYNLVRRLDKKKIKKPVAPNPSQIKNIQEKPKIKDDEENPVKDCCNKCLDTCTIV